MPIKVNPLALQELFFDMLEDLEQAHENLYNDELSKQLNIHYKKKRIKYQERLKDLMKG